MKLANAIILIVLLLLATHVSLLHAEESVHEFHKWYVMVNLLPTSITDIVILNLSFPYGKAYNNTLTVLTDKGVVLPFTVLDSKYYPDTSFYKKCTVAVPLKLDGFTTLKLEVRACDRPCEVITPTLESKLNLTLDEETGDLIVENDYYLMRLANSSRGLYRLVIKSLGNWSVVEEDWPSLSFVVMFKNYTMLTQLDIDCARVKVVYNSSLLALVEYVFESPTLIVHQSYLFNALNSKVIVSTELKPLEGEDVRNIYLHEIKFSRGNVSTIHVPLTDINVSQGATVRSLMPSPRWLCFNVINCSLALIKVYSDINITESLLRFLNVSGLLSEEVESLLEKYNSALFNYTNLGLSNLTSYLLDLSNYKSNMKTALLNSLVKYHNSTGSDLEKRDVFMCDDYVIYATQINETTALNASAFTSKVVLEILPKFSNVGKLRDRLWEEYLDYIGELLVVELPIEMETSSPHQIMVDDLVSLNLSLTNYDSVRNLTIAFINSTYIKLEQGNYTITLNDVEPYSTLSYSWIVSLLREGLHDLMIDVSIDNYTVRVIKSINVTLPPLLPKVPTSAVNLTVRCVDLNGTQMPNCVVTLINNETGETIGVYVTNETGYAVFYNLSLGTYTVIVNDGILQVSRTIQLYRNEQLDIVLDKLLLEIKAINKREISLKDIYVSVRDEKGKLVFAGVTDENGTVFRYGVLIGNYTITFKWRNFMLRRVSVNLKNYTRVTAVLDMYYLTVRALRDNKTLVGALVTVTSKGPRFYRETFMTDSNGEVRVLLPLGTYEVSVSKGQYVGSVIVTLDDDLKVTVKCRTTNALLVIIGITGTLWVCYGIVWRRYTSVTYKEREKYRRLLARLEELHKEGLVEDKLYQKLKLEYESKLREVGG